MESSIISPRFLLWWTTPLPPNPPPLLWKELPGLLLTRLLCLQRGPLCRDWPAGAPRLPWGQAGDRLRLAARLIKLPRHERGKTRLQVWSDEGERAAKSFYNTPQKNGFSCRRSSWDHVCVDVFNHNSASAPPDQRKTQMFSSNEMSSPPNITGLLQETSFPWSLTSVLGVTGLLEPNPATVGNGGVYPEQVAILLHSHTHIPVMRQFRTQLNVWRVFLDCGRSAEKIHTWTRRTCELQTERTRH